MKTKKEIQTWILKNCSDTSGDIDLSGLDFKGLIINFSHIKASYIYNTCQEACQIDNSCQKAKEINNSYHEAQQIDNISQEAIEINNSHQLSQKINNSNQILKGDKNE